MITAEEAVAKGVEVLDQVKPDWPQFIDVETLDLAGWSTCVLGQVFGDFGKGMTAVFDPPGGLEYSTLRTEIAIRHGFESGRGSTAVGATFGYADLDARWSEIIEERQRA